MLEFANATPNEGYLLAAALLREHVIAAVLTLNFDLAIGHALAAVGARNDVAMVTSPHQLSLLVMVNVIHLHGDVHTNPDELILRSAQLETAWQDGWQELIATRVMTVPVVVFAGLGSPAAVLVDSIRRIQEAMPDHVTIHVDPGPQAGSPFSRTIQVPASRYVEAGWGDFMRAVGTIVRDEQVRRLDQSGIDWVQREGYVDEDHSQLMEEFGALNLIQLGRLRAQWLLEDTPYLPARTVDPDLIGVLLYGIGMTQRLTTTEVLIQENGNLELRRNGRVIGFLAPASGKGTRGWSTIEAILRRQGRFRPPRGFEPVVILVSGALGQRPEVAPPPSLVAPSDEDSIVTSQREAVMFDVEEVRRNPNVLEEAFA